MARATKSSRSKPKAKSSKTRPEPSNADNMNAPAFKLAALDADFLMSEDMRGVRFMLEYEKTEQALKAWGVHSTIVVFGSARFHPDGPKNHAHWYNQAREFGRIVSERGGAKCDQTHPRENVIATGGGPGIMEAANRGAWDAGAPSIGFNIRLPHEQEPNAYSTPELTFNFHYFNMRKLHLAMRANALVVFPGGFGTMDELFEILCLRQTGKKSRNAPIILFDKAFWTEIVNFEKFVEVGTISPEDMELFCYAETAEEAWEKLLSHGLMDVPCSD